MVSGEKPTGTPSLADNAAEFKRLDDELFGDGTGVHRVGKGKVYAGLSAGAALRAIGVAPDFDPGQPYSDSDVPLQAQRIYFLHRKLADGEIYFLDNRSDQAATVQASFRVTGKTPELWYAETGTSQPASYTIASGRTTVPLSLEPWGTVFVVFRHPANSPSRMLPEAVASQLATVEGPWNVSFQPGRGAPPSITLEVLSAWNDNNDPGVKYFSGVWHLHQDFPGIRGLVQTQYKIVDRSGRCQKSCRGHGEWKASGHRMACALPGGCHIRPETRRQRNRDQGDQCLGEPACRRSAARD